MVIDNTDIDIIDRLVIAAVFYRLLRATTLFKTQTQTQTQTQTHTGSFDSN